MNIQEFLIKTLVDAIAVLICAYLLPGISVDGFGFAILVALALALLNQFVKPLLLILTIPVTIVTFGLFLLVINALIIMLADWVVTGFQVDGFWWAVLFSFFLALVKSIINSITGNNKKRDTIED
ncbi:MAG: phage holin family protein [Salibacteraceae bacterium]